MCSLFIILGLCGFAPNVPIASPADFVGDAKWGVPFSLMPGQSIDLPHGVTLKLIGDNKSKATALIGILCDCSYKIEIAGGKLFSIDGKGEFGNFLIGYLGYESRSLHKKSEMVFVSYAPNRRAPLDKFKRIKKDHARHSQHSGWEMEPKPEILLRPSQRIVDFEYKVSKLAPQPMDIKWIVDFEHKVSERAIDESSYRKYRKLIETNESKLAPSDYFRCLVLQAMSEYWLWLIVGKDEVWMHRSGETFVRARNFLGSKRLRDDPLKIVPSFWSGKMRKMYFGEQENETS